MELFGLNTPLFALIGAYLIGMVLIGYPMGKWSLIAWKYPEKHRFISKVLFPVNSASNTVGQVEYDFEGGSSHSVIMHMLDVDSSLHKNDPLPLAQYIVLQMIFWPIRIAFTLVACTVITILSLPTQGAKLLMRCKKCVEI
jgi:hypothetical protein